MTMVFQASRMVVSVQLVYEYSLESVYFAQAS